MRRIAEIHRERVDIERQAEALSAASSDERAALRRELGEGEDAPAAHAPDEEVERRVDLSRVRLQSNASLHGLRRRHELALQGAAVLKRLEHARRALLEATTRRRAVELLKERRFEAWAAAERTREAREVDELVTARFGRPEHDDGATT